MIVVSDTSPLNYLIQIDCVFVLPALYDRVVVPGAVLSELHASGSPAVVTSWAGLPPPWLQVIEPTQLLTIDSLDVGEVAAISLARELGADSLLMDERKGVAVAREYGLAVERTPTVLTIAAERGLIDLATAFSRLKATNFRIPHALLDQLLADHQRRR